MAQVTPQKTKLIAQRTGKTNYNMKKITRSVLALSIILSSCTKQETEVKRNWMSPTGLDNFCEDKRALGESGTVGYKLEENLTDAEIVQRVKQTNNLPDYYVIFLSPTVHGDVSGSIDNLDPEYLAFPLHSSSMSNKWSQDYYEEYLLDKQAFLNKYTNGKETGGMKYCNL
tara:strand:+ start:801 stop:1313 length:513 start_codon:yes stop_codon:yes gene_type:complete